MNFNFQHHLVSLPLTFSIQYNTIIYTDTLPQVCVCVWVWVWVCVCANCLINNLLTTLNQKKLNHYNYCEISNIYIY